MQNPIQESAQSVTGLTDIDAIGLFDHLPGMVYRCRWDGDWTMEFVSQGSQALTGYRPEDLTANPTASWSHLIHTDDLGRVSRAVRAALKQGEAFGITYRLSLPDGTEKWVIDNGRRVSPLEEYPPYLEGFVSDVTDQRQHEAEAREWRAVVEEVPVALVTIDAEGRIKEWNRQAESVFGWKREVVLGESFVETIIPSDPPEIRRERMRRLGELQVSQVLSQNLGLTARDKAGREFPIELTISARRNGESAHFNAFIHDISQRKGSEKSLEEANKTISRLMRKDPLTGLANRKFLEEDMVRTLSFARRWRQPLTLVMGDVDHFKDVNEQHGYQAGDKVLVFFTKLLEGSCRAEDLVARLTEGFVLLLPNTGLPQAVIVAERIRRKTEGAEIPAAASITASFGLTRFIPEDTNETFIARAKKALNQAKDSGRNRIRALEADPSPSEKVPAAG